MKTYRADQHQIQKPSKMIEHPDGYEVISNDGTIKVRLLHTIILEGSMESGFYYTKMWIKEGNGWAEVNNTQSYRSKEEFIDAISESEDFTQALSDYKFNNQNNNEL